MQFFTDADLPAKLLEQLTKMQFTTPTPIQAQAIPLALEGRDILGSAQTGTGKTGAFGIPLVAKLLTQPRGSALVMTPTRELATQVHDMIKKMVPPYVGLGMALLIGGDSMVKQLKQLKNRPRIIVGTPGRIFDHLERGSLMLHDTQFLVLDETDRMLDLGFGIQLDKISKYLTAKRQTMLFSATLPDNIIGLSKKYLTDPVRISVGSTVAPAANLTQKIIRLEEADKYDELVRQLNERTGTIIIFAKTKRGVDKLALRLVREKHNAEALHGDLRQNKRDRIIAAFREQKHRILVATDVAARGLDIPHIEHVINYDLPQCPEDYIHRIGRTARAGADGEAICLLTPQDRIKWRAIEKLLNSEGGNHAPDSGAQGSDDREGAPRRSNSRGRSGGGSRSGGQRSGGGEYRGERTQESRSAKPGAKPKFRSEGKSESRSGEPRRDENRKPDGAFSSKPKFRSEGKSESRSGEPRRDDNRSENRNGKPAAKSDRKPDGAFGAKPKFRSEGGADHRGPKSDRKPEGRSDARRSGKPDGKGSSAASAGGRGGDFRGGERKSGPAGGGARSAAKPAGGRRTTSGPRRGPSNGSAAPRRAAAQRG